MLILCLQSLVLSGATVHSMVPGKAPERLDVVIEAGQIRALVAPGASTGAAAETPRFDATGLHLFPGLIDGMVNHDAEQDRLYVASGVTLVRDLGSDLATAVAERDPKARQRGPGPSLWVAGAAIGGADSRSGVVLETPEEAQQKLTRLLDQYPLDYFSILPNLKPETWKAVIGVAHARKLRVWGPLLRGSSLSEVIEAGQDGLFHIDALLPSGKAWTQLKAEDLAPRVERLGASTTALVPTLALHAAQVVPPDPGAKELGLLGPIYLQQWLLDGKARKEHFTQAGGLELQKAELAAYQLVAATLKSAFDKGVVLVPGSASPAPWLLPGRALVEELVLWGKAGIPPAAVVRAATQGAARALGDERHGTIEVGKAADLVAYARDPEQDLSVLREPRLVVLRGNLLERARLDELVSELEQAQRKQQLRVLGATGPELAALPGVGGERLVSGEDDERVQGLRLAHELYAVTRQTDGSLTYQTRILTLGGLSTADTELYLEQSVREERLSGFVLEVKTGPRTVKVKGTLAAGVLNVERWLDGQFVSNVPVKDRLVCVDIGGLTPALALAQHARNGAFKVLFFDDFEPAVGPWEMHVDEQGTLLVRTHAGFLTATFDAQGKPGTVQRELGRGVAQFTFVKNEAAGAGLPLPEANRKPEPAPR